MIRKIISSLMLLGMVINAGAQTYLMDNTPVSTCAGIFYDAGGSAGNYSSSQSFTKTFTSDNGQRISFNFQDFVLYADGYDYLEVFDGPTSSYQSLGKYYGTNSPGIVTSTGTSLTFYFYSNSSYASTGWSANISCSGTPLTEYNMATGTVNGCDGVFYDNAGGGASYSNSQDLTMTFCSGTTDHIIFDFVNFSLSTDDTLYAYDGSTTADPMIGAYTGASLPEKIYSRDGPCITFRFVSNATTVSTGWKAYISCSATAPTPAFNLQDGIRYTCEGTFYDNGGSSGNYSSSFMKTMTFHSFNGEQISFNFQSFALYADGYDYLEIFDGPTSSYPSLGTYYGTSSPGIVTSTGTSLTFFFYSNSSYAGAGWSANISCSGTPLTEYNMTSGTVATCEGLFFDNAGPAANYPHNENRTMTFSSGSTDKITFDFTHFSMSTEDTLYAFDGTTTSAQMIGAYTGTRLPETIYSKTGNSVTFKFVSNSTTNSNGWRALIGCSATVPAQDFLFQDGIRYTCGGTFYDNGGSTGNYTSSQNKYMVFYSDNGNRIQADFTSFALYNDGYDFMEIFDGPSTANPSLGKYYSTNSPGVVTSTGTSLTFYLYSNSSYASTGWEADLSCTTAPLTDYTMTSGTVSTCEGLFFDNGGAAGNYPNNENRVMTFTSGTTDNIVFEFTHFSVSTEDTLYAYDGATTSDPLIGIYTGTGLPEKIYSKTGNSVTFKFKSGTSTNSTGWRALISCSALDPGQVFNMQTGIRYTCGGTFNDNGGSTGNYSSSFSQAMTFKSDNGNRLTVDFSTFNLYGDGYDYLEIFDGPSNLYPSLGKYYGSNSPGIVTSANDALTFQFYSNSSYASSGWTADISCGTASLPVYPMTTGSVVACEGIFTDSGGQGAAYLQNEDNTMTFCSGTTDRIVFEFTHFYVNTDDTLFAYDGSSTSDPLIGIYTGFSLPEKIYSKTGNCVTFRFKSNNVNTGTGWRAFISCETATPEQIFTMQTGVRYTCGGTFYDNGGSTSNYSSSFNQTMTFHSDNGNRVQAEFTSFVLYADAYDYLEIYDGPTSAFPLIGRYYATSSPGTVLATGDALTFYFYSNSSYSSTGWVANMSCQGPVIPEYPITTETDTVCDGLFTDSQGQGAAYLNNEDETITFCSGSGDYIYFDFSHFSVSGGDTLFAYDGTSTSAPLIGAYTGTSLPEDIYSKSGNSVTFRFVSNATTSSDGWRAYIHCSATAPDQIFNMQEGIRYTCGGTFYDNGGSAGSYSSSLNKTMYFNSDNGNKIKFTFTAFSLYGDGYDYLEIFDGPSTSSPLIGKYYSTSNPGVIESSGTSLTFHFYSNSSYSGTGWTADIECTTPPMLDVPMTSGSVTTCYAIFSDNGGTSADYPNNENREMTFSSGSSEYIIFDFTHFNVASGDTLFAYDGTDTNAPIIGAYTGTGIPEKIYSESGNSVTFKFTSNATTVAAGWRAVVYCDTVPPALEYTMADGYRYTCDGTFYDDGGASSYYSSSTTRTLTLFSENNHRVSLNFQTFSLYNDGYDYVEIYDGPTVSHYRIGKYMSNSSPGIVTSTGNCLTIKSYANSSYAFPGWEAAISCTDTALTTYILAEDSVSTCEAVFCDPGGPMANYLHNDDQTTTFYPDGGNYIIFDFQTFDVIADDTLYAFDGEDISAPLIGKYYGNNLPEKIYNKTGDAVTFRFVTGVSNAGAGWRAMISCSSTPPTQIFNIQSGVRYTCGGTFYDPGGTAYYHANDYEIMTFVSDNGNRIAFDFQSFTTETGYDYLYIYDGPTTSHPLIGTYSGSAAPGIVQSTGTSLTFRFNSDGSNQYSGFMANISCTTPPLTAYIMSSGTVNTCSGIFYDNGGPAANYPHNENRTQTFCSDNGQYIIFDFTHSSISTDDTLYVHDGASTADPLIGVYTGSYLPEKIWSKSGTCVTFRFVSGTTNNSSGWRALISCSAVAPTPAFTMQQGIRYTCGGTFLDQGGSGYYSNSLSQTMTYHSENGNRLQFNFLSFSTETGYDKLYVYDGPNNSYPIIGTYSGSSSPGTVTSTGDALTFYFNCDGSNQYPGWSASISCAGAVLPEYPLTPGVISDCEGVFYDSGGPAANYANSEDITETFCSDNGQLVKFIFLPLNFSLITGDSLYVFDGADINAAPLAIYTGGSFADTLVSSGTCLTFRFKSDASSVSSGWKAMLGCTSVPAVPHIYNMSSGVRYTCDGYFTDSGGSGGYYGASENKTMTFISAAGDNCGIRFNFSSFSTETGYDKLYIYDGPSTSSTLIGTYSGGTLPGTAGEVQGTGNALTFRFTSDGSNQYSGWFATISCPGQTAAPTVTNNSPVCSGDTLKLMAADITGATYFWTGPNGFTSMAQDTFIFPTTAADAGIYSVVATVSGCSSNSGYTQAIIHDPANTATTVSGPVCEGGILQLSTSDVTGAAFTWSGPNGFSSSLREPSITNVTTDASGWYYVSVVVGTCTVEDSVQATVNPSPDAMNPLSSGTVCEGSNVNLSVTGTTGANYLWTGPDGFSSNDEDPVLSSVTISSEGWYYVTATLGLCSINDSVEVSIDAAYTAPVIWTNGPLCEAENLYLQSSFVSGVSYLWNNPDIDSIANTQNAWVINVAISDTGWYYLETERGTCALTDSIHVAISQHPTNPALAAQFDACEGQDLTIPIVGTVGATYSWTGPNGYTSSDEDAVVSGIAMADAGNYYLEVSTGACSFTDSTEVVVNQTPVISAISSNSPICSSDTLQLFSTTSGGSEFAWTGPNSFISDVEDPMIIYPSVAFNGWYYLTVTAGACSTLDSAVITIEQAPENPAVTSNYNPLCTGDNLELYAVPTTAATYEWSGPGGYTSTDQNPVINSIGSADAGTYYVTVTYGNCTATDNIDIQVYDMPVTVNLVTNAPVCGHDTLTVDADHVTGASYLWNGPMSYTNNNEDMVFEDPMPFNTGYYVVEVSIGGCSLLDSVYAEIYAVPDNPDIQADITLCAGETLAFTITETASATYAWTGPNGFNSTEISPSISNVTTAGDGIYTVVATLGTCTATDNIDIQIDELPATLNLATNGPVCAYNALNISSDNITGAAYAWTGPNGFTSSQEDPVIASPVTANTGYYVVEVSLGACAMSDSVYAVVNDGPANPNIQATTPLCASNTLIFAITETAGADYVWSGPNGFSSALAEPEIFGVTTAASGVYSITATIGSCSETDQISVTVNTAPPVPVVSNDGPVCEGDIVHLSATNVTGFDYDWYGPNGFHSFSSNTTIYSVELADSGVYTFIVNQGSCSSSASTTVQVYPVPAVPVITQNGTILEAPAGYAAYEWYYNYGFTPVGTSQTYNAGMNYGNYTVIVFSAGGCSEESNDFDYIWTAADMPESGIAVAVFPNPFRHSTNLAISLPEAAQVEAKLMTITGEEAAVLYSGNLQSGKHAISIDADALNLSAGIYVVQLQIDQATYHVRIAVQ